MEIANIKFYYDYLLWLLLALLPLIFLAKKSKNDLTHLFSKRVIERIGLNKGGLSQRVRIYLLLSSLAFGIIALSRPYIEGKEIEVKSKFIDMVVGFDISNSMFVDDIYPNRFEFAKQKFSTLLKELKDARVAIIGFSSRAFLIAPMTNDYNSLKYLTSNMSLDYVSLKGTSLLSALKSANMLYGEKYKGKKALLLFTDGGDKSDFSKEIEYAKTHNISVFVYATATKKGGVIKTKNGILKDKNGNIVISKLNSAIKELALKSGGAYMEYSLSKSDMKRLSKAIKKRFRAKKDKDLVIKENKELFVYPLFVSVMFLFASLFSLPQRKRSLS